MCKKISRIISLTTMFIFMACISIPAKNDANIGENVVYKSIAPGTYQPEEVVIKSVVKEKPFSDEEVVIKPVVIKPVVKEKPFSDEEVKSIVKVLVGECYDDKLADKRKVAEVIVNRLSDGRFGGNIIEIVTAPGQFCGYWKQSRPVSESDIQIAEETLTDWYMNNCKSLSTYLFFCSGPNRENIFRSEY